MSHKLVLIALAFFLAGCTAPASPTPTITLTNTPTVTHMLTPTPTATPTITPIPTQTSTPTQTYTPTPTHTPQLPVRQETPFPTPGNPITLENAAQMRELARYGAPVVRAMQLSGDRQRLFVATSDGLSIFDAHSLQLLHQLDVVIHQRAYIGYEASFIQVSQDGERFALLTDTELQVRQADGELLFNISIQESKYTSMALSPDGQLLFYQLCPQYHECSRQMLMVDNHQALELPIAIPFFYDDYHFLPDGAYLVGLLRTTGTPRTRATIWRLADWSQVFDFVLPPDSRFVGFSPDSSLIAVWQPTGLKIYRSEDGALRYTLPSTCNQRNLQYFVFSPDSNKITYARDCTTVRVWELTSSQLLSEQEAPVDALVSLDDTGELLVYSAFQFVASSPLLEGSSSAISYVSFSPQDDALNVFGVIYFSSRDIRVRLCRVPFDGAPDCTTTGNRIAPLRERGDIFVPGQAGGVYIVRHLPDSDAVEIYGGDHQEHLIQTIHIQAGCEPLLVSADGRFLVCSSIIADRSSGHLILKPQSRNIWDLSTGQPLDLTGVDHNPAFSPDGRYLVGYDAITSGFNLYGYTLVIYDLNQQLTILNSDSDENALLTFHSNYLISCWSDSYEWVTQPLEQITLLDLETGITATTYEYPALHEGVTALQAAPNSDLLAIGYQGGWISLLNLADGSLVHTWQAHSGEIARLAFSSDGRLLASSGGDGFVKVWGVLP